MNWRLVFSPQIPLQPGELSGTKFVIDFSEKLLLWTNGCCPAEGGRLYLTRAGQRAGECRAGACCCQEANNSRQSQVSCVLGDGEGSSYSISGIICCFASIHLVKLSWGQLLGNTTADFPKPWLTCS